ncbi:MAG: isopentenyl-diphosphate Delta-isomerase [Proteobacteria bacterium]|nr:isopentenyl-diphosphate Delta-isomerase [Pseudomonadota bacterium]
MKFSNFVEQNDSLERVILVDSNNQPLGLMDKLLAHQRGSLHRAFSVFIFSEQNELLLQKRAATKYHSSNQWANTCCGHPRENETTHAAANRRLNEEMGLSVLLKEGAEFIYKAELSNNLIEHEYVQFFTGTTSEKPKPNPFEVSDYLWISREQLFNNTDLDLAPWFKLYLKEYPHIINDMFSMR